MFLSGYGNLTASSYGFTKFFAATLCLIGFCKVTFKLDSYLSSLGVNLGRPTTGMGALGLMMAAGRIFSHVGRGSSQTAGGPSGNGEGTGVGNDSYMDGSGMTDTGGPIPMGFGNENMQAEDGTSFGSGMEEELADASLEAGDFDTMADGDGSVLEEMGMMPEDGLGNEDLAGMEEQSTETVFGVEGSASGELGDYPVEREEPEAGEIEDAGMNLDGTGIGNSGAEDGGIGNGMDVLEKDGISAGSHIAGTGIPGEAQGILSEIGSEAGISSGESFDSEGVIETGNAPAFGGETALHEPGHGMELADSSSGAGQQDTKVLPVIGGHEVNGLGYHDFDTPGQTQVQGNPGAGPGIASSESRKQEYQKITEERKLREVPKSRKDLKKKKKQNPKPSNGDSKV